MRTNRTRISSCGLHHFSAGLMIVFVNIILGVVISQAQESSLSSVVDSNEYIIGPGDKFRIDFWDGSAPTLEVTVTPEGYLLLSGIGRADIGNLLLSEARTRLRDLISKYYSDVAFSITLVGIRSIKVLVSGAVKSPGMYDFVGTQRVSEALVKAGGIIDGASIRKITLNGADQEYIADLLRYERIGDLKANPYLFSGYRIFVPLVTDSSSFIQISGEVVKAGGYEYREGDNLGRLLEISLGLTGRQEDSLIIFRGNQVLRLNISESEFPLAPGDKIIVMKKAMEKMGGYYSITGEISLPGRYPIKEAIGLGQALKDAGGLTSEADFCSGAIFRQSTIHRDLVSTPGLKSEAYSNFTIAGGNLPLSLDLCRFYPEHLDQIIILPGDSIAIPFRTGMVGVFGYVSNPGMTEISDNRTSAGELINRAGGYSPGADRGRVEIIRRLSGIRSVSGTGAPIYDGDAIIIPAKHDPKRLLDKIKDIALIAAATGVIYLAIDNISD